jgi:PAS domain S-box-containing protein
VSDRSDTSASFSNAVARGLATILALHLVILATTKAMLGQSLASQGLQTLSVVLACVFAGYAAIKSRDFARVFWAFSSAGFALLVIALVVRHFERGEGFGLSDFLFLLHMVPFGLVLLLGERSRTRGTLNWPMILDFTQILIIVVIFFIAFIYIPSKGATVGYIHSLYAAFAIVLIARNVSVTSGFWFRTLLANSDRERLAFGSMGVYLLIYTVGSALTHYIFLNARSIPVWIELQGSIPFLVAAWLFSRWHDLPATVSGRSGRFREALSLHLIPAVLPLVVAASANWTVKSEPRLARLAVTVSLAVFALRLLATIHSEYRANEAARRDEQRYGSLVLAAAQIVWTTNARGEISEDQPTWAAFSGMRQEEIRGWGWIQAVHPDDRQQTRAVWSRAVQSCTPCYAEYRLRGHDGEYRHMAVRGVPVLGAGGRIREWVGTCTDVSERKRAEEALRLSQQKYRVFFEQNLVGNYIATPEGVILACNPAFVRMFGFASEEEAKRTSLPSLYASPRGREEFLSQLKQRGHLKYYEEELRRKDGSSLYVTENAIGITSERGELVEVHGFLIDETERRNTEQQLRQAHKMEAIGKLAGGIAHDFNNILSVIVGHGELLLDQPEIGGSTRRHAQEILDAGHRAASLTRQLLAFCRKQVLEPRVLNLNRVIEGIDKMLRRLIGDNIEVKTVLADDLENISADPGQMGQVILNFCVNARDAMPEGGRIIIETRTMEVDESFAAEHFPMKPGRYVRLEVSDSGIGMDKQTLAQIFEPFFTTKGPEKGTGLGLATVYGIVKQSGGYVWTGSEPGQGSTFSVYLPVVIAEVEPPIQETKPLETMRGSETILVVEDAAPLRALIRELLECFAYTVLEAEDAERAHQIADHQDIDLLLTDLSLPKTSGLTLAQSLRKQRPGLKVLYMSGYPNEAVQLGVQEGDTDFLQKPFTQEALAQKLRNLLDAA